MHLPSLPESMTPFNQQVSTLFHLVGRGGVAWEGTGGEHWGLEARSKTSPKRRKALFIHMSHGQHK